MYDGWFRPNTKQKADWEAKVVNAKLHLEEVKQEVAAQPPYTEEDIERDLQILAANLEREEREMEEMLARADSGTARTDVPTLTDNPALLGGGAGRPPTHQLRSTSIDKETKPH